jgi:hypothetical protein
MTPQEMTKVRDKRIMDAFNLEKPDRVPIFLSGQGFFKYVDPKATLADYFRKPKYVDDLLIQAAALPDLAEIDQAPACGYVTEAGQAAFGASYFAKVKLPGRDLPDDSLWNFDELGPMTEADYDTIIDKGWPYMVEELNRRIGFDPKSVAPPDMAYLGELEQKMAPLGKASIGARAMLPMPAFEVICAARRLNHFVRDLRRMPDKVRAAMEIVEDASIEQGIKMLKEGPPCVYGFIGGTRAGSTFISAATFEKFYFPFYQKLIPAMQAINIRSWLHMDNDWAGFLHFFKEFDKRQCIWDPDQMTDILKIKEVLGDRMCITGNVSPALLSVGTPDQCYDYAKKQCADMGKEGFIMASGCSVPVDAKRENVAAVISATMDS